MTNRKNERTNPDPRKALIQRIRRHLAKQGEQLRTCRRGSRYWPDLGDYYTVDSDLNVVVDKHFDVEEFAREHGLSRR
jgi:hypothetical protein